MGKATQDLRNEHDSVLYVLQILDHMMQATSPDSEKQLSYYKEVLYFLKVFVDQCHHGKEEKYLFNELVRREIPDEGGLVGVMLQDHALGRDFMGQMRQRIENEDIHGFCLTAGQYSDLIRQHIEKENNVLFMMAD